ncbi:MAG: tetratricopeptide repeat protein [Thermoguttaceae bacterium]|jgi:TolA-binding protein
MRRTLVLLLAAHLALWPTLTPGAKPAGGKAVEGAVKLPPLPPSTFGLQTPMGNLPAASYLPPAAVPRQPWAVPASGQVQPLRIPSSPDLPVPVWSGGVSLPPPAMVLSAPTSRSGPAGPGPASPAWHATSPDQARPSAATDPTWEQTCRTVLDAVPALQAGPARFVRLAIPDPSEPLRAVQLENTIADDDPPADLVDPAPLPVFPKLDHLRLARALCDQCDMLLRAGKHAEAAKIAAELLADKTLGETRYGDAARYCLGYVHFLEHDYRAAGQMLSRLAPFGQSFGVHARYLLARIDHLARQRPEAAAQYGELAAEFQRRKKIAEETLKRPQGLRARDRAPLEAMAKGPAPDYLARAAFYAALLALEDGRYSAATDGFTAVIKQHPHGPLADEAQLRLGICHAKQRNLAEAAKALQLLQNHPSLADRATWWLARVHAGAAGSGNPAAYDDAMTSALELFARAADRAAQLGKTSPHAVLRRGEILLDLAEAQQTMKQYKDAAATYEKVVAENSDPDRAEEALERLATVLHLDGRYAASDAACRRFEKAYPASTLTPSVWFRAGENSRLAATAGEKRPARAEADRLLKEAITRYRRVLQTYPDFILINQARFGLGQAHYHLGQHAEALAVLSGIPASDRVGELSIVSCLIADCLIRMLPGETNDALQAADLIDRAEQAAKLLEGATAVQENTGGKPANPAAAAQSLLKLGYCYQRIGLLMADPAEKKKFLAQARAAYDRLNQQVGRTGGELQAVAAFERAKCIALAGDAQAAAGELNRFQTEPLAASPTAPPALIRAASLLRWLNRPADALKTIAACRDKHEAAIAADPQRKRWSPVMQCEHALALKEAGKYAEARTVLEGIVKQFPGRPQAAEAAWRLGQCRREELMAAWAAGREALARAGNKADQVAAANKAIDETLAELHAAAESLSAEAAKRAKAGPADETCLRMFYEAAWCRRALADVEIDAALARAQPAGAPGKPSPSSSSKHKPTGGATMLCRSVSLDAVPLQPAESAARQAYTALIAAAPDAPLAARARLELAEMLLCRQDDDAAVQLLAAALRADPPVELSDRIRVRLAGCLLAKNQVKAAIGVAQVVAKNPASSFIVEGRGLTGEGYYRQQEWAKAISYLTPFRDQQSHANVPEISDRALLRLGQALTEARKWEEAKRILEGFATRFPQSPWIYEARYGLGRILQHQNQLEQAIQQYTEVTRGTAGQVAAAAQLQIGLCRLAQKRFTDATRDLAFVPLTYSYPEQNATALCEAGQAYLEMQQPAEAVKLWEQVIKEFGSSPWAAVARERLATLR